MSNPITFSWRLSVRYEKHTSRYPAFSINFSTHAEIVVSSRRYISRYKIGTIKPLISRHLMRLIYTLEVMYLIMCDFPRSPIIRNLNGAQAITLNYFRMKYINIPDFNVRVNFSRIEYLVRVKFQSSFFGQTKRKSGNIEIPFRRKLALSFTSPICRLKHAVMLGTFENVF